MHMQDFIKKHCTAVLLILLWMLFAKNTAAATGLHAPWSELLGAYVKGEEVDYKGMKSEEKKLDAYLDVLDATDPSSLSDFDRLALYINAYNAYTVKLILKNFKGDEPVTSIKKLGGLFSGPWKIAFCRIGGEVYTLDNIEHDIIRPQFKESRVHFAVNCASKSCPPLISTAYNGAELDKQLEDNAVAFINDKRHNYLDGSTLYVSKIFKWFAEDFNNDIGSYIKKYARGELLTQLDGLGDSVTVRYLDYDWSLNGN